MEFLTAIPQSGFWLLVLLTVLVFVHEFGHYIVARWCGVRVEVFSIGFGKELFGRTDSHGTRWKFSAIPLGGYVKMYGQGANLLEGEAGRAMTEADKAVAFDYKPVWRRMAIVVAGPAANYIFAALIFAVVFAVQGKDVTEAVVGQVSAGSVADKAGMQPGDRIVSLNGTSVTDFDQVRDFIQLNLDQEVAIEIDRNGAVQTLHVRPAVVVQKDILGNDARVGQLGVAPSAQPRKIQLSALEAAQAGAVEVVSVSKLMLKGVWQMITGHRPASDLGGIVRIGYYSGEIAQIGFWSMIWFAALLSVNLGMVNLFPIPLLDGGHLVFFAIEGLRGKPLPERTQEWGFRIGIALVLSVMLFAAWNDLVFLDVIGKLRALFT